MNKIQRIYLTGIPIDRVNLGNISLMLIGLLKTKKERPKLATYINAYHFNLAQKDKKYFQILKKADILYADGWGVVLAARLLGKKLDGRLTTYDFFFDFCELASRKRVSLFLLGGGKGIAKRTRDNLKKRFSDLEIKGYHDGFFKKTEEIKVVSKINRALPDFLILNMGSPKQEIWFYKNLFRLKIGVGWCVGGLFDFISGSKPSCPKLLGDLGFEWLFRLFSEPERLWRRYLIGGPEFFCRLIKLKLNL